MHKIWFVTSAWERDGLVTLNEKRVLMNKEAVGDNFDGRLLVLNNFKNERSKAKAIEKAKNLIKKGLFDDFIIAPEYIKNRLSEFGIDEDFFWENNPYFSTIQLATILYLKDKSEYLFYLNGDVIFDKIYQSDWIDRAIRKLDEIPNAVGFNLCRNIYKKLYANDAKSESKYFWILSTNCLSDHAFVLKLKDIKFDFSITQDDINRYQDRWPKYATPCFEMLVKNFVDKYEYEYCVLKPENEMPTIKHKNISSNKIKEYFYLMLGRRFMNGKYGTKKR